MGLGLSKEESEPMEISDIQLSCPDYFCSRCFNMSYFIFVATLLFLFLINQLMTRKINQDRQKEIAGLKKMKMGLRRSKEEPKKMKTRESQSNCLICQSSFKDLAQIENCQHEYCFDCIVVWTQFGHRDCPYCRRGFDRVKHNIRSETDFDWHWTSDLAELRSCLEVLEVLKVTIDSVIEPKNVELDGQIRELEQKVDQLERDAASWNVLVRIRTWLRSQLEWAKRDLAYYREYHKEFNELASRLYYEVQVKIDFCQQRLHDFEHGG